MSAEKASPSRPRENAISVKERRERLEKLVEERRQSEATEDLLNSERAESGKMSAEKASPSRPRANAISVKERRERLEKLVEERRQSEATEDLLNSERATNTNIKEQPVAADGFFICRWQDSMRYDPVTGELNYRARKSSTTSIGSNRRSCEIKFAEDNEASGADQVESDSNEDAPAVDQDVTVS